MNYFHFASWKCPLTVMLITRIFIVSNFNTEVFSSFTNISYYFSHTIFAHFVPSWKHIFRVITNTYISSLNRPWTSFVSFSDIHSWNRELKHCHVIVFSWLSFWKFKVFVFRIASFVVLVMVWICECHFDLMVDSISFCLYMFTNSFVKQTHVH